MKSILLATVLSTSILSATCAIAGSITWDAPQQISSAANVSLNGNLIGAINLDGPATSVNGVAFQAMDIAAGPVTIGNFTVDGFFFNQSNPGFSTASAATPFSDLDAGYRSLLGTGAAVGGTMTLMMAGLTMGENYEFQAWVNDSRDFDPNPGFTFAVDIAAGNSVTLDPNLSVNEGGLGQYILGTFSATSATQLVTFTNDEVAVINGFQLRQVAPPAVPEPGTALFGLALIGTAGFSRRRSAAHLAHFRRALEPHRSNSVPFALS